MRYLRTSRFLISASIYCILLILAALTNISILDFSFDLLHFADAAAFISINNIDFEFDLLHFVDQCGIYEH